MEFTPTATNYFELFGLPEQFIIDINVLNERYLALQQVVHPDNYSTASNQARLAALQKSAILNDALRTLKEPLARANYLLSLRGFHSNLHSATTSDAEFLMEQLQLREELAVALDVQAIDIIVTKLKHQYDSLMNMLAHELNFKNWLSAQNIVYKLQFLSKLQRSAEALLDETH
jgi:molecular chaperone HscB